MSHSTAPIAFKDAGDGLPLASIRPIPFVLMVYALRWFAREAGLRFIARRKAAFAVAVLTMALALGANTIVFSVLKTFFFSSIGVPEADRLLAIMPTRDMDGGRGSEHYDEAYPNFDLIRRIQHTFAAVTLAYPGITSWDERGEARPLNMARVTASFFSAMRVSPRLGRVFSEEEQEPRGAHVVVVSHAFWKSALAGDPGVVGRAMRLDGEPYTVIGVMPEGFALPHPTDIWIPLDVPVGDRVAITGARHYQMYGRLTNGRTIRDAEADAIDFTKQTVAANADNREFRYEVQPMREELLGGADSTVLLVQEGAVVLLLLAVLNLASLLIAWGFERQQELAVRQALGAAGARVFRLLALQSLVVVGTGAVIAVGATSLTIPWLRSLNLPSVTYFTSRIALDGGVLAVSAAVAMIAGLVAGVLPAWFGRNIDLAQSLRSGGRSMTHSAAGLRWQKGMVVVQAALSLVVLAAAALVGVSFRNLQRVPNGFSAHGAIVARVQLDRRRYPDDSSRAIMGRTLLGNLSREPSIAAAGFTSTLPVSDEPWLTYFFVPMLDGSLSKEPGLFEIRRVSPNYLATIGIPLLFGRQLDEHDDANAPPVAVVSRRLALRLWPDQAAIGKRLYRVVPGSKVPGPVTVVGVVADVMDEGASAPPGETVYIPWSQLSTVTMSLVVRPRGSDAAAIRATKHALQLTDPLLAAHDVASLDALVDQANAMPRLQTVILFTFAAVATLMAMLGCYGVMRQLVATREREYATRLVFGASPADLGRSVLRQVARLTVPGVMVGLVVVVMLRGVLAPFVFGVSPRSVVVLSAVGVGMLVIGIAAALPSVVRAMRVDIRRSISP
jgi:putative ABC transport system permease protein